MKQELQKELSELKQKVESIEKRIESMPDEKGKWVPEVDDAMFLIDGAGNVEYDEYEPTPYQKKCVARGNCYPTEHAAIEAREQQDNGAPKFSTEQTARHLLADASPEYKCLQCGWAGLYTGIKYDITCNSIRCSESVCPECGASWPVPFDDVIETI